MSEEDEIRFSKQRTDILWIAEYCFRTAEQLLQLNCVGCPNGTQSFGGDIMRDSLQGQCITYQKDYEDDFAEKSANVSLQIGHTGDDMRAVVCLTSSFEEGAEMVEFSSNFDESLEQLRRALTEMLRRTSQHLNEPEL